MKLRTLGQAVIMCACIAGCTQGTSRESQTDAVPDARTGSETVAAVRNEGFDHALIAGKKGKVTMTTHGHGSPDSPIGIDFDFEIPETED
jgi:hypothetical protein